MSKIIIHYIWFKDYRRYKKQGINFSLKYTFDFDENTGTLKGRKNENYIENFYGENIDLSVLVGENGTGKTSFLTFLLKEFYTVHYYSFDYIVVYETDGIIKCINSKDIRDEIKECDEDSELFRNGIKLKGNRNEIMDHNTTKDKHGDVFGDFRNSKPVYISEMFNSSQFFSSNDDNYSIASIIRNSNDDDNDGITNPVTRYIHKIMDWQIEYLTYFKKYLSNFNIRFPDYCIVTLKSDKEAFTKWYCHQIKKEKELKNDYMEESSKVQDAFLKGSSAKWGVFTLKDNIAKTIFLNLFSLIDTHISPKMSEKNTVTLLNLVNSTSGNNLWDKVYSLLEKIDNEQTPDFFSLPSLAKKYLDFMEYFNSNYNNDDYIISSYEIKIPTKKENTNYCIYDFFKEYKKAVSVIDFFSFDWGLSSGETMLLNIFAKLNHFYKKITKNINPDNVLIMLDEAEVALHPEWQRNFLDSILEFIKATFTNNGIHVQLIIATHSPIILSDVLKQNTVYLRANKNDKSHENESFADSNYEHEETFGANIYKLYNNAFFMQNGAVGEFAKNYIRRIKSDIGDSSKTYEEIEKDISIIGDEFIRNQLYLLLNQSRKVQKNDIAIDELLKQMNRNEKEELFARLQEQLGQ